MLPVMINNNCSVLLQTLQSSLGKCFIWLIRIVCKCTNLYDHKLSLLIEVKYKEINFRSSGKSFDVCVFENKIKLYKLNFFKMLWQKIYYTYLKIYSELCIFPYICIQAVI